MSNFDVVARLAVKDNGFTSGFQQANQTAENFKQKLAQGLGFGAMAKIGGAAVSAVGAGIKSLSTDMVAVGSNFEEAMSKVGAISGASQADMAALTDKAKEMGATTKFSASESAEALQYMAMAGWKTTDMLDGLEGIMSLAAAAGEDLGTTSDIVTDALTAFGMEAKDSGHFADILASASSNANTNMTMLGESFKYVAPVAGALGYSAEDATVCLGLMANSGIKASQAGTALRSTITRLTKPTDDVAAAMDELGISIADSSGKAKPLKALTEDLRSAFSGLTEEQKVQYAASISGQEAMSGLLAIVNASEKDYSKLTSAIADCDGAAAEMAATMGDNLKGKLTIAGSAMEGLGIAAYDKMQGPLSNAVDKVTDKISDMTESMENGKLGKAMEGIADGFSDAADVAIDALDALGDGIDFAIDHSEALMAAAGGVATAWASVKVGKSVSDFAKDLTGCAKPLTTFKALTSTGMKTTDAFLGVLESGSGPFKSFAVSALHAGGGIKGVFSAITACISPVGLLTTGIGLAAGALAAYCIANKDSLSAQNEAQKAAKELSETYKEYSATLDESREKRQESVAVATVEADQAAALAGKVEELAGQENKSAAQKAYLKGMVDQLNSAVPDLNLAYDEEADKLSQTTEEINNKISAMKEEAEVAAWQAAQKSVIEDIAEATRQRGEAEKTLGKLEQDNAAAYQNYLDAQAQYQEAANRGNVEAAGKLSEARGEWRKTESAVTDAQKTVQEYEGQIKSLENEYADFGSMQTQLTNKKHWDALIQEAADAGVEIPEKLKAGIEAGSMQIPGTVDELKGLMDLQSLLDDAEQKGAEIPQYLASGIASGSIAPQEAVEAVQGLITWQDAVTEAGTAGADIVQTLTDSINAGTMLPQEAVQVLSDFTGPYAEAKAAAAQAGFDIPSRLSEGVTNGTTSVQDAVTALNSMVEFSQLCTTAQQAGADVPSYLTAGISSGSLTVEDATLQLMSAAQEQLGHTEFANESGLQLISGYIEGFQSRAAQIAAEAKATASAAAQALDGSATASQQASKTLNSYNSGVRSQQGPTSTAFAQIAQTSSKKLDASSQAKTEGTKTGQGYASGVRSQQGPATTAGTTLKNAGISGSSGGYGGMYSNGAYMAAGITSGFRSGLGEMAAIANGYVAQARRAVEAKANIHSPSKVFARLGAYMGAGLIVGMESMTKRVGAAAETLVAVPSVTIDASLPTDLAHPVGEGRTRPITLQVIQELDGKEISRGTVRFDREAMERQDKLTARMKGVIA